MIDYITKLETELKEINKNPFVFKGILCKFNLEGLNEKELFEIFFKEGVYIEKDPLTKYEIDRKNILKYGEFYGFSVINPILYYDFFTYCRINILVEIIGNLFSYKQLLLSKLEFKIHFSDKIKYLKKKINIVLKEIGENDEYDNLFTLFNRAKYREELVYSNWLDVVESDIIYPHQNSENKIEKEMLAYLTSSDACEPDPNKLSNYNKWLEIELIIHKLELLKEIIIEIKNAATPQITDVEDNKNNLNEQNKRFLEGISEILIKEDDISIFEDVLKLPQAKNIPFFTAVYNYFGIRKKKFNIDSPKIFFDKVNESYHLNMKRLRGIDMPKYTNIEIVFKKILEKWEPYI